MKSFIKPMVFAGDTIWPTIAFIALTHGNEPVGLSIFAKMIEQWLLNRIKSGTIMLICSNIHAHKEYVVQDDPLKYRFIDHDMNRIWNNDFIEWSQEYKRREELKLILLQADIIIDIHSVSKWDDVLGIVGKHGLEDAIKFMDVQKILVEWNDTTSMRSWLERHWKYAYGIEAWNHISENGLNNGFRIIQNLLIHYWIIDGEQQFQFPLPEKLEFIEELKPTVPEFRYARDFNNWELIEKWEIYAYDGEDNPLTNNLAWDIRIGLVQKRIQFGRGAWFLFRKI